LRHDVFVDKKSVHVKLTKEVHAALREKLFRSGITMQDLFQETAEMVLSESPKAQKLIENIAKKKMRLYLEGMRRGQVHAIGALDSETLYNLLEQNDKRESDEE
jgi:hypothetical protein